MAQLMTSAQNSQNSVPIQLAFVITELEPGGAEQCLAELATRIDRRFFSPVVYSLGPRPNQARDSLTSRLATAGVPTHFLGFTKPWQYFAAVQRLAEMLREQRAEIVQ